MVATKRFTYPMDKVPIPHLDALETPADAWDYASKVYLRMSQRVLFDRHLEPTTDAELADGI
ncbi:MAG TPA: hypothetical protein VIP53_03745 [Nitrososphaera sp.]